MTPLRFYFLSFLTASLSLVRKLGVAFNKISFWSLTKVLSIMQVIVTQKEIKIRHVHPFSLRIFIAEKEKSRHVTFAANNFS